MRSSIFAYEHVKIKQAVVSEVEPHSMTRSSPTVGPTFPLENLKM